MKRVYVAGPYSADNVIDVLKNIGRGEDICADIFMAGMAPFCPWHDKSYVMSYYDFDMDKEKFKECSIAWLKVSDAIFCVPGWEKSGGTLREIKIAGDLNIPIFTDMEKLIEWSKS
jgi:hypothetical protein